MPTETLETDCLIIGAGAIGLACGAEISAHKEVILVEKHSKFGQETSSRNSEVIHSGIYYPEDSYKTRWCIQGRKLLYDFCEKLMVPHKKVGKLLVATHPEDDAYLERLAKHCDRLKVPYETLDQNQAQSKEPLLEVTKALFFPESGVIDSHRYMGRLESLMTERGGMLAFHHQVTGIEKHGNFWTTQIQGPHGGMTVKSQSVINAAGLAAGEISQKALGKNKYEHRYCRGRYFMLGEKHRNKFQHLIYPVPQKDGLGIHVTVDLDGYARLGPDVDWCEAKTYAQTSALYDCDWESLEEGFQTAASRYCPSLKTAKLTPGLIGIRPKLFKEGQPLKEFIVESNDGFVHCLGVESPGLTASLAIAQEVAQAVGIG